MNSSSTIFVLLPISSQAKSLFHYVAYTCTSLQCKFGKFIRSPKKCLCFLNPNSRPRSLSRESKQTAPWQNETSTFSLLLQFLRTTLYQRSAFLARPVGNQPELFCQKRKRLQLFVGLDQALKQGENRSFNGFASHNLV